MKFIFATGGTGGHIMPAIAIREAALSAGHEVAFIHSGQAIDEKICAKYSVRARVLKALPFTGKSFLQRLKLIVLAPIRFFSALSIFREEKPDVVVGFGGYVSFIPLIAAKFLGIKTAIQEQNGSLGLANKILAKFVDRVFIPEHCRCDQASHNKKYIVLNNPVRSEFEKIGSWTRPATAPCLLAIGGSQGAVSLNSALMNIVKRLHDSGVHLSVMHQTGPRDIERVSQMVKDNQFENYTCMAFTDEMAKLLDQATVVLSRAGALSVAEIGAAGRPAVFVPLNIARSHQHENVAPLERVGSGIIVVQNGELEEKLFLAFKRILTEDGVLAGMADAARSIRNRFNTAGQFVRELTDMIENAV